MHMSCMPGRWDFSIYEADTCTQNYVYKDAAGQPINLTGYTIKFTAKKSHTDVSPFFEVDGAIADAAAGSFNIPFLPATTQGKTLGAIVKLKYDLQLTDGSGNVNTITFGDITLYPHEEIESTSELELNLQIKSA